MPEGQKELLLNFGEECVCMNDTHGLNDYGFKLDTLPVLDNLSEPFLSLIGVTLKFGTWYSLMLKKQYKNNFHHEC